MSKTKRDIFLCHASEDKVAVVRPLAEALGKADISCWYDEAEIRWGDSITRKINEALRVSRYVIVILSPSFLLKNWPQRELDSTLSVEASSGAVKALPLLVGNNEQRASILAAHPLLNDKRYLTWDGNPTHIVTELIKLLGQTAPTETLDKPQGGKEQRKVPLPKIKLTFSQRDQDIFLRNSFAVIKAYFSDGLHQLESHNQNIECDMRDIHNEKFISTIYDRGKVVQRCKVWLGGFTSSSIAYLEGTQPLENNDAMNDWLTVGNNDERLGIQPQGMSFGIPESFRDRLLTPEEGAEYLWRRFTQKLSR